MSQPAAVLEAPECAPLPIPERKFKKTVYTVCVDNYEPAIRELTYPLLKHWAAKIHADLHVIDQRKHPDWPITMEKLQIYDLARERGDDWAIYFDSDALINPEYFDPTELLTRDTVCHNGRDFANVRWVYDSYFRRDGRNIGSCNWHSIASSWCLDLWHWPDIPLAEALKNIHITVQEHLSGQCKTEHLIDDYSLSRNIARFGLKFTTLIDLCKTAGFTTPDGRGFNPFLWHIYASPTEEKLRRMLMILSTEHGRMIPDPINPQGKPPIGAGWGLMSLEEAAKFRKKWNLKP